MAAFLNTRASIQEIDSRPSPYTIVLLGSNQSEFVRRMRPEVRRALEHRVRQLGLAPSCDVAFLDETCFDARLLADGRPISAVFFGSATQDPAATAVANVLVQHGAFVVPVVDDLETYGVQVPDCLRSINGDTLGASDELAQRVASLIAVSLGLLRRRRLVFLSYKRSESQGVARQLHDALGERGFEVFLDTHSVEKGVTFQPVLWDRMADADVVILLDTPGAFTSRWVEEEISKASMLGLAILQLVWPGHHRTIGTDLCDADYLDTTDFNTPGPTHASSHLRSDKLGQIAATLEDLRARSFVARRLRLVGVASRLAASREVTLAQQIDGHLTVQAKSGLTARIIPLVGHPDATQLHSAHDIMQNECQPSTACVLYDPASMLAAKHAHLKWLSEFLPLKALSPEELDDYLARLAGSPSC